MTIPFWCVLVAAFLIYFPRVFVMAGMAKRPEGYDNRHPRDQQAKLEGWARRAQAAHLNAFEGFAPFAAAVIVAHLAGADAAWSAWLAIAYCVLRFAYTLMYVGNLGSARSLVWIGAMIATAGLYVLPAFS